MMRLLHVLVLALGMTTGQRTMAPAGSIEVLLLTDSPEGAVALGLDLGAEEMSRTAGLLNRRFRKRITTVERGGLAALPDDLRRSLLEQGTSPPAFLVIDLEPASACAALDSLALPSSAILLLSRAGEDCGRRWLQLRLPRQARATLLEKSGPGAARVDEWHHSLVRFGAEQLNDRFERHAGRGMNGDAWAGWFAAKVAAEASLRLKAPRFEDLAGGPIVFDGHKGSPLRFDRSGRLIQPVYAISGDDAKVTAEISPQAISGSGAGQ